MFVYSERIGQEHKSCLCIIILFKMYYYVCISYCKFVRGGHVTHFLLCDKQQCHNMLGLSLYATTTKILDPGNCDNAFSDKVTCDNHFLRETSQMYKIKLSTPTWLTGAKSGLITSDADFAEPTPL